MINSTLPPQKVLIVDDAQENIETLEQILSFSPYEIHTALSGEEGLKIVDEIEPDIILLDVMMPGLNGYEVAQKLKAEDATRLIPIVMLTALDGQDERVKGYQAGVDDFISKPFNIFELQARVKNLLELRSYIKELDHAEQIIFSLARTVEAKDKYTEGHSERLSIMSSHLGKKMGLGEQDCTILRRGGILHDIGKIAIDDAILKKEGPLTADEFKIIKTHPVEGERICAPLKSLKPVLPVIMYHHEKMDGSGYPLGLKGKHIPIHARIMGIVDCFDALTTTRSYRPAMSLDQALAIMDAETEKGKWDADIFKIFLEMVENIELPTLQNRLLMD